MKASQPMNSIPAAAMDMRRFMTHSFAEVPMVY
jgi:hypothetical protein